MRGGQTRIVPALTLLFCLVSSEDPNVNKINSDKVSPTASALPVPPKPAPSAQQPTVAQRGGQAAAPPFSRPYVPQAAAPPFSRPYVPHIPAAPPFSRPYVPHTTAPTPYYYNTPYHYQRPVYQQQSNGLLPILAMSGAGGNGLNSLYSGQQASNFLPTVLFSGGQPGLGGGQPGVSPYGFGPGQNSYWDYYRTRLLLGHEDVGPHEGLINPYNTDPNSLNQKWINSGAAKKNPLAYQMYTAAYNPLTDMLGNSLFGDKLSRKRRQVNQPSPSYPQQQYPQQYYHQQHYPQQYYLQQHYSQQYYPQYQQFPPQSGMSDMLLPLALSGGLGGSSLLGGGLGSSLPLLMLTGHMAPNGGGPGGAGSLVPYMLATGIQGGGGRRKRSTRQPSIPHYPYYPQQYYPHYPQQSSMSNLLLPLALSGGLGGNGLLGGGLSGALPLLTLTGHMAPYGGGPGGMQSFVPYYLASNLNPKLGA